MSFAASESPATSSSTNRSRRSTYQEAEPLPFCNGFFAVAPKWVTDRFNDHWSNGSQTGQAFCSAMGELCHGPIDGFRSIMKSEEVIAYFDVTRPDDPGHPYYWYYPFTFGGNDAQLGITNKGRLYWGREDQPADAWLRSVTGQSHPPYRGRAFVVFERIHCGQIQANSKARPALPSYQFSLFRLPSPSLPAGLRLPAALGEYRHRGVNIVSALYDLLSHPRGGLGLAAELDTDDWVAKATALENGTKRAGGAYGPDLYISPTHTGEAEAEQIVDDYLKYLDGFLYRHNGKLRIDWFPNDGQIPAELPEITHHEQLKVLELNTATLAEAPSKIVVSCLDALPGDNTELADAAETAQVPFVRELTGGENRVEKLERPWFTDRTIAKAYAARVAVTRTVPAQDGKFIALPSRAVRLDGSPLRPGDLVRLNWEPLSLLVIARITERMDAEGGVELTWERERGITPLPYTAAVDPRADYALPTPATPEATDWTVVAAPPQLAPIGAVVLCRRPQNTISGLRVHFDQDGDWVAGATVLGEQGFAARVTLNAALASGAATVDLTADADGSTVLGSGANATEQANDEILLVIDNEWLSVGTVTNPSAGVYQLGISRGRFGSAAAAHASGAYGWLLRRERLAVQTHASFTAEGSGWFKVQTYHPLEDSALSTAKTVAFALPQIAFGITLTSGSSTAFHQPDGTTVPRLKVALTVPANTLIKPKGLIRIQYKTTAAPAWSDWTTVLGDQTSDFVTDVLIGTSYLVRVRYEDPLGAITAWVTSAAHTVQGDTAAPDVPTGLTPVVGTGKAVSLSWNNVTSANLGEYGVYRNTVNDPGTATKIAEIRASRFVDTEVALGTQYFYYVTSISRSEVESAKSAGVTATPSAVAAGAVDGTPPANPGAPTLSASSAYNAGDGTVFSRLVINIPAMPAGAAWMNLLYRKSGSSGWIVADQRNSGGGTSTIDDLSPGIQYDVAIQAFSTFAVGSGIIAAVGSPFTAPNSSAAPNPPTGLTLSTTGLPARFQGMQRMPVSKISWSASSSPAIAYYEVKAVFSNDPASITYTWYANGQAPYRTADFSAILEGPITLQPGYVFVRAVDRSGNASSWAAGGAMHSSYAVPAGSMTEQNANDVSVSAIKTGAAGAGSVRKVLARYPIAITVNLTGGSVSEQFDIDLSGRGFSTKPDTACLEADHLYLRYFYWLGNGASTSTNARCIAYMTDGSNVPAGAKNLFGEFVEYD